MQPKIVSSIAITQSELPAIMASYRITAYPVIVRALRAQQGGGFGDQARHPHIWTVMLQVDGLWARVESSRGTVREWGSLDRLERWLRAQGFRYVWLQNELDPVEAEPVPRLGLK